MAKYYGCFCISLLLAAIAASLANGEQPAAVGGEAQQRMRHVRSSAAGSSGLQCQACSKEVCMRVDITEDCSSLLHIVRYNDTLMELENRINDVVSASAAQQHMISSLESLVEALEEKINFLSQHIN